MSDAPRRNFFNLIRIQKDLEKLSGTVLARLPRAQEIVADIAELDREAQDSIYHWTEVIALSNDELAAHFVAKAGAAYRSLDQAAIEDWIIEAMDAFDHRGLGFAIDVLDRVEQYAARLDEKRSACRFEQVAGLLRHLVCGFGGRPLGIASERAASTDSEKIYLPSILAVLTGPGDNARLYKCLATYLWAQNRFGTWRYRALEEAIRSLDAAVTWPVYQRLECVRLTACIGRELPGIARDMEDLGYHDERQRAAWQSFRAAARRLVLPEATARDSLSLVAEAMHRPLPAPLRYEGEMFPARVREVLMRRVQREKTALRSALSDFGRDLAEPAPTAEEACEGSEPANRFSLSTPPQTGGAAGVPELRYNEEAVPRTAELDALLESILQDMGELDGEYLTPQAYPADAEPGEGAEMMAEAAATAGAVLLYPEWDYTRQRFRDGFCALTEQPIEPGDEAFVEYTRAKYRGLSKSIQRAFEAILSELQRQRRQPHGDELDLDALVEAHADLCQGRELSDRVFTHFRRSGRSVAVMFMVDMSGSTKGWVNDAERESLILLCEAVQSLGDAYAIYGFSGRTNKRCEVYRIKTFDEPYSTAVRRRIAGMTPRAYTRMGAAIRHLGSLLAAVPARSKLLVTLSDGKPEDYGSYRGRYGIEDTRHALLEVRRAGIHPFCITIDREAQSYLPHMYGPSNYTVVDEVRKLPYKVADIYRRLTT